MASTNVGADANPLTGAGNGPSVLAIELTSSWVDFAPHWVSCFVACITLFITICGCRNGRRRAADDDDLELGKAKPRNQVPAQGNAEGVAYSSATSDSGHHTLVSAKRSGYTPFKA